MSNRMPLSFSRLNVFEQCPARFDYQYVSKRVKDSQNEASAYGDRVHKTLEALGNALTADPADTALMTEAVTNLSAGNPETEQTLAVWAPMVVNIAKRPGKKMYEHQMTINENLQPTDWFGSDVWIRSVADVLVVDGATAVCLDWKSGKVKADYTQLQLFAAMTMWHYPEVQTVKTGYVWLKFNEVTNAIYKRQYLGALWDGLRPRFDAVQAAIDLGVFPTKPSGLCPWCPAKDICPDARQPRKR